jgi:hypothetical protein
LVVVEPLTRLIKDLGGQNREFAWHTLRELGASAAHLLESAYSAANSASVRAEIVKVITQWRRDDSVPFLVRAFADPAEDVWQAAIGGLLALESTKSAEALKEQLEREAQASAPRSSRKAQFLAEAVTQLGQPGSR